MNTTPAFRIEQRTTEPLMVSDCPHEDYQISYPNVIRDGKVWHMWYEAYDHNYKTDADGYLCYARSEDGVKWEKPDLGLVPYNGTRENNIVIAGPPIGGVHGHTVFMDPMAPEAERFKLVFTKWTNQEWQVYGETSPDGIRWTLTGKPLLARNSDTQTVCYRDRDVYRLYVRMWSKGLFKGQRMVGYTESKTFGDFPDPVMVLSPDEKDPADLNLYNSAATRLKDSVYVMFPSVYHTKTGIVVPHMATSTDGRSWVRMGREPKLPLGRAFDNKSIYVGPGAVPGNKPDTWWMYYSGYTTGHDDKHESLVQHMGGIGRFLLVLENPANLPSGKEAPAMGESNKHVRIELSQPVTVAMAPPEVRGWGPYQFPVLLRLPDGRIQASFHVEADSATAYGLPPARAVSADEGRTWTLLPREAAEEGASAVWDSIVLLPNGDRLKIKSLRSRKASELRLPEKPFAQYINYGLTNAVYRVEDLPAECAAGWMLQRLPAGHTQWQEERATVRLPGEVRTVTEGVMWFPWLSAQMIVAPDGALWSVNYTLSRVVDGRFQEKCPVTVLRSTDAGRSWDIWSEIPYAGDAAADPKAGKRLGFTEPYVCFMPDGSSVVLMRTTDGEGIGPLYGSRSTDSGKTWAPPAVFDDLGVWPQMLTLENGVTLAAYGRPGLYIRATTDPAGLKWEKRVTVVEPARIAGSETCSYAALLPLNGHTALVAYSDFNLHNADGKRCKGIQVREVTVTKVADQ